MKSAFAMLLVVVAALAAPAVAAGFTQQLEIPGGFQIQDALVESAASVDTAGFFTWNVPDWGHGQVNWSAAYDGAAARWEGYVLLQGGLMLRQHEYRTRFSCNPEFQLTGLASGTAVPMRARWIVQTTGSNTTGNGAASVRASIGFGNASDVELWENAAGSRLDTLVVSFTATAGTPIVLRVGVVADASAAYTSGAVSTRATAHLEFVGIPPGAAISNAHGFFDDRPSPLDVAAATSHESRVRSAVLRGAGAAIDVRFSLDRPGDGRLELLDVGGRRLASMSTIGLAAGEHAETLRPSARLAAGVWFVVLRQNGTTRAVRLVHAP